MKKIHFYLIILFSFMINIYINASADEIRSNLSDVTISKSAADSSLNITNNSDYLTLVLSARGPAECMYKYPDNEAIPPLETRSYTLEDDNGGSCWGTVKKVSFDLLHNTGANYDILTFIEASCSDPKYSENCKHLERFNYIIQFTAQTGAVVDGVECGGANCLNHWVDSSYINSDVSTSSKFTSNPVTIIEPANESTHSFNAGDTYYITPSGKSHPYSNVVVNFCNIKDTLEKCQDNVVGLTQTDSAGNWTAQPIRINSTGQYTISVRQMREGLNVVGPNGNASTLIAVHEDGVVISYVTSPTSNNSVASPFTVQGSGKLPEGGTPKIGIFVNGTQSGEYDTYVIDASGDWVTSAISLACGTQFDLLMIDRDGYPVGPPATVGTPVTGLTIACATATAVITNPASNQRVSSPFTVQGSGKLPDGGIPKVGIFVNGTQSGKYDTHLTAAFGDVWATGSISLDCGTQFNLQMINSDGDTVGTPIAGLMIACATPTAAITSPDDNQELTGPYYIEGHGTLSSGKLPTITFKSDLFPYEDDNEFSTEWVDQSRGTWRSTVQLETNCSTDFELYIYDDDGKQTQLAKKTPHTIKCAAPTLKLSANKIGPNGKTKRHHRHHFPFSLIAGGLEATEAAAASVAFDSVTHPGKDFDKTRHFTEKNPHKDNDDNWLTPDIEQSDMDCGDTSFSFMPGGKSGFSKARQGKKTTDEVTDLLNKTIRQTDGDTEILSTDEEPIVTNDRCKNPSIEYPKDNYAVLVNTKNIEGTGPANTTFTLKDNYASQASQSVTVDDRGYWSVASEDAAAFYSKGPHHIEMTGVQGATDNTTRYYFVGSSVTFEVPSDQAPLELQSGETSVQLKGSAFHIPPSTITIAGRDNNGIIFPTDGLLNITPTKLNVSNNGKWTYDLRIADDAQRKVGGWYLNTTVDYTEFQTHLGKTNVDFTLRFPFAQFPNDPNITTTKLCLHGFSLPKSTIALTGLIYNDSVTATADEYGRWYFIQTKDNDADVDVSDVYLPRLFLGNGTYNTVIFEDPTFEVYKNTSRPRINYNFVVSRNGTDTVGCDKS